jgi:hypothetical protein
MSISRREVAKASKPYTTNQMFEQAVQVAMKIEDEAAKDCCAILIALVERSMGPRP